MTTTPTSPGFYYFRPAGANPRHVWVAQVCNTRSSGLFATVTASIPQDRIEHVSVDQIHGEWFGPLPSPESYETTGVRGSQTIFDRHGGVPIALAAGDGRIKINGVSPRTACRVVSEEVYLDLIAAADRAVGAEGES
jgi:hypothetical protein